MTMTKKVRTAAIAMDEYVIIVTKARSAGTEDVTASGIILGVKSTGEIPEVGTVYSVGLNVPKDVADLLKGSTVVIPNGRISHVPHPAMVAGLIDKKEADASETKYISTHYKNIQAIYYKDSE
ncbi:hypothetical protein MM5_071 [Morganella phage vB_Mm5]